MKCDVLQKNLPLFLYGELSLEDEEKIHQHLAECAECQAALAKTEQIHHALMLQDSQVPDGLLVSARRGLRDRVAEQAEIDAHPGLWRKLTGWMDGGSWILRPALGMAVMAVSFLGGRMSNVEIAGVMPQLGEPAAMRVRYVEPDATGKSVQIALDETRQRVVQGSLEDPSIRELLFTAAKDPSDAGLRAESVEVLCSRSQEAEVRDALLHALEHDANVGVRLRALEGLKSYSKDSQTRQVLSRVLLKDTNPGVRAQAVDVLTQVRNKDMVGTLQELLRKEDNDYVRLRTQRVLQEMNASPGIF